jgi:hypothetical protein
MTPDQKACQEVKITFDIQPMANEMGVSKEKLAELLLDGATSLLFPLLGKVGMLSYLSRIGIYDKRQ